MTGNQKPRTVLMLVATTVASDTRVLREAGCLAELGLRVIIVGRDVPPNFSPPAGISVLSSSSGSGLRTPSMGSLSTKRLPVHLRLIRWLLLPAHRRKSFKSWGSKAYEIVKSENFDAVHAHDFTALELGARLARERGIPYIYDSHEWWVGRQRQYRPTPIADLWEARREAALARQATAVITVGESIARLMERERDLAEVFVVRNSFPLSSEPQGKVTSPPKSILYAGRIDAHRELEVTIAAAKDLEIPISWMGDYENQWAARFVPEAKSYGIQVFTSRTIADVTRAMQEAGLAFVIHSDKFESHRLALPNKLFHAVHAGVPVIATDVPELAAIVRKFDIGELYEAGNAQSMKSAIRRAIARHQELISNVLASREELSWESDAKVLKGIYTRLFLGAFDE